MVGQRTKAAANSNNSGVSTPSNQIQAKQLQIPVSSNGRRESASGSTKAVTIHKDDPKHKSGTDQRAQGNNAVKQTRQNNKAITEALEANTETD